VEVQRFNNQAAADVGIHALIRDGPVWVIAIKGEGLFSMPSIKYREPIEGDWVSYAFLERTGTWLSTAVHLVNATLH
jgi:hypothetical protein